ncbi:MAG: hypothetical protein H6740_29085, partial [Alphaproteobacteria bacterium]|nr:hypothetical protein [Alphaproteobacteria bacterium]
MTQSDPVLARLEALRAEGNGGEAADLAADLVMRVYAISDRALMPEVIRAFCAECDDAGLLAALQLLFVQARRGNRGAQRVAQELALNAELFLELEDDRARDLWRAAQGAGLRQIAGLFSRGRPKLHNPTVDEAAPENESLPIPLGLR